VTRLPGGACQAPGALLRCCAAPAVTHQGYGLSAASWGHCPAAEGAGSNAKHIPSSNMRYGIWDAVACEPLHASFTQSAGGSWVVSTGTLAHGWQSLWVCWLVVVVRAWRAIHRARWGVPPWGACWRVVRACWGVSRACWGPWWGVILVCHFGSRYSLLLGVHRQPPQPLCQRGHLSIPGATLPVQPGYGLHHDLLQLQAAGLLL
jgi:hypothetical protein